MKRTILLTFIVVMSTSGSYSQEIQYYWQHDISPGCNILHSDNEGFLYIGGRFSDTLVLADTIIVDNSGSWANGFISKVDTNGNTVWIRKTRRSNLSSFCLDHNDHIYAAYNYAGHMYLNDSLIVSNNVDTGYSGEGNMGNTLLTKYDLDGNLLWCSNIQALGVLLMCDSNDWLVVHGHCVDEIQYFDVTYNISTVDMCAGFPSDYPCQHTLPFLVKYNPSGGRTSVVVIGSEEFWSSRMIIDHSNNVIISGNFYWSIEIGDTTLEANMANSAPAIFIAKFSPNLSFMWAGKTGGDSEDGGLGIGVDSLNNIYLTGYVSGSVLVFNNYSFPNSVWDRGFIAKYDSLGNYIWANIFESPGKSRVNAIDISKGRVLILGTFYDYITLSNVNLVSPSQYSVFMVNLAYDGSIHYFGQTSGNISVNTYTSDLSHSLLTSYTGSVYYLRRENNKAVLAKLDDNLPLIAGVPSSVQLRSVIVLPNPSNGRFNIYGKGLGRDNTVRVFSLEGKLVFLQKYNMEMIEIDISFLDRGIYLIEVINDAGVYTQKVFIEPD